MATAPLDLALAMGAIAQHKLTVVPLPGKKWRIGSSRTRWYDAASPAEGFELWARQYASEFVPPDVSPLIREVGGLGRIYAPDPKDRNYLVTEETIRRGADRVRSAGLVLERPGWRTGPTLNQGSTSECVGHAWAAMLAAAPYMLRKGRIVPLPSIIYKGAQDNDEWPGNAYLGTSVRGAAKWLVQKGLIKGEYRWCPNLDVLKEYLNNVGPIVAGTDWYDAMFRPRGGFIVPEGYIAGGHAYLVVDHSKVQKAYRILNSWGGDWGENGRAWIDEQDFDYLVFQANGEACSAVEEMPLAA